jgi:hypothetical protein
MSKVTFTAAPSRAAPGRGGRIVTQILALRAGRGRGHEDRIEVAEELEDLGDGREGLRLRLAGLEPEPAQERAGGGWREARGLRLPEDILAPEAPLAHGLARGGERVRVTDPGDPLAHVLPDFVSFA